MGGADWSLRESFVSAANYREQVAAPPRRPPLSRREFVALMASCMGMAALSIDLMLPAFPDARADFGLPADSTQTSWIITAFFLGLASGQLVYGPLSDRYGRKPLLYIGLGVMSLGAALSALAPSLGVLVACRVLWGIGAAAPRSLALAMVRDTFAGDRMARTMSHIMATFVLVPVLAPGLGSVVLSFAPWRTLFWIPALAAIGVGCWARRLPETLPPERRRPPARGAFRAAAAEVVRTPQTIGFAIALTCLFGIMSSYIASSELIVDEVFDRKDQFPIIFGVLALFLAAGSFTNARLVERVGLFRMLRGAAVALVGAAAVMAIIALVFAGEPPLLLFGLSIALLLPVVAVLMPNSNTAAMLPLPHVAGTAAAMLGTVSTAGGSLLGSIIDARFDGTVAPFAQGLLVYALIAFAGIFVLGLRNVHRHPAATMVHPLPAED
jgi:MFS transporter, DHA1 family, multidrug resistance protein